MIVVIPARNVTYAISFVLDALTTSVSTVQMEASSSTHRTIRPAVSRPGLPCVTGVVRLPQSRGLQLPPVLAPFCPIEILFLDADMVLPHHAIHERTLAGPWIGLWAGIGFGENIHLGGARLSECGRGPDAQADFDRDHRVN
jgi:hypothetical protein